MAKRKKKKKSTKKKTAGSKTASKKKAGGKRRRKPTTRKTTSVKAKSNPDAARVSSPKRANPEVIITLTHDQIARKAYEIWVSKGRPLGQDEQNWDEAVADLKGAGA